ncbi:hypothetical protein WJX74_002542 [Apatococcus lobatus]|uniref:Uncharacterized protein n=2 Tax=Apatococcus TaxID=904362 RepID=A0AAW1SSW5_9CHLO
MAGEKRARPVQAATAGIDLPPKTRRIDTEANGSRPQGGTNLIEAGGKTCSHEVAWPSKVVGDIREYLPPAKHSGAPATTFPFSLDPFQQTAINCLEAGHSVLVAAHTSAGKTVVAEYAFGMALRDKQRVIYTSPLKALSNQKFRDFQENFGDVGLLTGDITINPEASCLVMTTEILRSMLYRGSEIVREAALVVYDEIHYLRDKERGVVWEESLIMLPDTVRYAFLSATIPNARDFAAWIAELHGAPCHVVYTDYRPVPLQHYIFPDGSEGIHMVVDERGKFREDNFQKAIAALAETTVAANAGTDKSGKRQKVKRTQQGQDSNIFKLVQMCMLRDFDPVIVFSFSKRDCETLAGQMGSMELNTEEEQQQVTAVFNAAVDCLGPNDRKLPQITGALPYLKRGIGIHHSGLLPLLKEVIELLFQNGLIKVLFATETFSTGLNMPAKTVVFNQARKFDGQSFRWITSGEYIQMSGRAGRRGLDDRGIVIVMLDTRMEPAVAKDMVKGAADPLHSAFRLSGPMLLNLTRLESWSPDTLLMRSFRQFEAERDAPAQLRKAAALREEASSIEVGNEEDVVAILDLLLQADASRSRLQAIYSHPANALPFLQPGRLVCIPQPSPGDSGAEQAASATELRTDATTTASTSYEHLLDRHRGGQRVWGALVSFGHLTAAPSDATGDGGEIRLRPASEYFVDILVNTQGGGIPAVGNIMGRPRLCAASEQGTPKIVGFQLDEVLALSSMRIKLTTGPDDKDFRQPQKLVQALRVVAELQKRQAHKQESMPLLDGESDLQITDKAYRKAKKALLQVEKQISSHPLADALNLAERLAALQQKHAMEAKAKAADEAAREARGMVLKEELRGRRRLLRKLGHTDRDFSVLLPKGQVAAELQSADELVLSELVFDGTFSDADAEQVVALLASVVWREHGSEDNSRTKLREDLKPVLKALHTAAHRVAKAMDESGLTVDSNQYVQSFGSQLMEPAASWYQGVPFASLLKQTNIFEGSLVRAIRRIEEVLQQLITASRAIGEIDLQQKFATASTAIKRDIIFAASLYL